MSEIRYTRCAPQVSGLLFARFWYISGLDIEKYFSHKEMLGL